MYKHITQDERYQIDILLKAGKRQCEMAELMNRSAFSISRELKRNRGRRGYRLKQAQALSEARRKRHTGCERRDTIPHQVSIELRPEIANRRERFGDWEADWVIGAGHQQALVTINERTSRDSLIAHIPAKTAQNVTNAMISLLTPFKRFVHTRTTDNGKAFAQHKRIAATLAADFFFAHPYASWERGANENMNGLIREFFPKKMRFEVITQKDGLPGVWHLPDLLPLSGKAVSRACRNRRPPDPLDPQSARLGVWAVLPIFA